MAKTPDEMIDKVREIYNLARASETPLNALTLQAAILLGRPDWAPAEVEHVTGEVLEVLLITGWKKLVYPTTPTPPPAN